MNLEWHFGTRKRKEMARSLEGLLRHSKSVATVFSPKKSHQDLLGPGCLQTVLQQSILSSLEISQLSSGPNFRSRIEEN